MARAKKPPQDPIWPLPMAHVPFVDSGVTIWYLGNRWRRLMAYRLRSLDLTPTQFLVLHAFARIPHGEDVEGISQQLVADWLGMGKMTVSQVARQLDERGLLSRDVQFPLPAWAIMLTAKGERLHREAMAVAKRVSADMLERPQIRRLIDELQHAARAKDESRANRRKKGAEA